MQIAPTLPPPPTPTPAPQQAKAPPPGKRVDQFEAAPAGRRPGAPVQAAPASSLRTEQLGDGSANCLERAMALARPGDQIALFNDSTDGVGHAVVVHED